MAEHDLKCWPPHFDQVAEGVKTFELRYNDRGYQVGDYLNLKEFVPTYPMQRPGRFTGRTLRVVVTHLLRGFTGIEPGYVILSIRRVDE